MIRFWLPTLLFVSTVTALCAEDNFRPRFEVGTSFVVGDATELVLRDGTYNNPLSRLVWSVPPALSVDLSVDMPWANWTSTGLALQSLWPVTAGSVVDEDWNTGPAHDDLIYGRSEHRGLLTSHVTVRLEQQFSIDALSLLIGGSYRRASWEAWNGTYHYQHVVDPTANGSVSGLVLEYSQTWFIPFVGAGWTWRGADWLLSPTVRFSPYSWCFDIDNHMAAVKRFTYVDSTVGGLYLQSAVEALFGRPDGLRWGLRAAWEVNWGAAGDTLATFPASSSAGYTFYAKDAGAWFQETSISVFVRN